MIVNQSGSGEPQPKGDTPADSFALSMRLGVLVLIRCQLTAELGVDRVGHKRLLQHSASGCL